MCGIDGQTLCEPRPVGHGLIKLMGTQTHREEECEPRKRSTTACLAA